MSVPNTNVAGVVFDGISYQKGSTVLKQLMFLMGEDNFFRGLQEYFKLLQFQNGTIDDFLNAMRKYFDSSELSLT